MANQNDDVDERKTIFDAVISICHINTGMSLLREGVRTKYEVLHPDVEIDEDDLYYHVDFLVFGLLTAPEDYQLDVHGDKMAEMRQIFEECEGIHGLARIGLTSLLIDEVTLDVVHRNLDFAMREVGDVFRTGLLTFEFDPND